MMEKVARKKRGQDSFIERGKKTVTNLILPQANANVRAGDIFMPPTSRGRMVRLRRITSAVFAQLTDSHTISVLLNF